MNGYKIVSARYANAENTAIELVTSDFGAVMVSAERTELWQHAAQWIAKGNTIAAYVAPEPEEQSRDLLAELDALKATLVRKNVVAAEDVAFSEAIARESV